LLGHFESAPVCQRRSRLLPLSFPFPPVHDRLRATWSRLRVLDKSPDKDGSGAGSRYPSVRPVWTSGAQEGFQYWSPFFFL